MLTKKNSFYLKLCGISKGHPAIAHLKSAGALLGVEYEGKAIRYNTERGGCHLM